MCACLLSSVARVVTRSMSTHLLFRTSYDRWVLCAKHHALPTRLERTKLTRIKHACLSCIMHTHGQASTFARFHFRRHFLQVEIDWLCRVGWSVSEQRYVISHLPPIQTCGNSPSSWRYRVARRISFSAFGDWASCHPVARNRQRSPHCNAFRRRRQCLWDKRTCRHVHGSALSCGDYRHEWGLLIGHLTELA